MGIDKYNEECRSIVMRYSKEWETIVHRMGRWIDFEVRLCVCVGGWVGGWVLQANWVLIFGDMEGCVRQGVGSRGCGIALTFVHPALPPAPHSPACHSEVSLAPPLLPSRTITRPWTPASWRACGGCSSSCSTRASSTAASRWVGRKARRLVLDGMKDWKLLGLTRWAIGQVGSAACTPPAALLLPAHASLRPHLAAACTLP